MTCTKVLSNIAILLLSSSSLLAGEARIDVHADHFLGRVSRHLTGACIEDVNHEIYGGIYSQMIFGESLQEPPPAKAPQPVSGMWRPIIAGNAVGRFAIVTDHPFAGVQSQQIVFESGSGEIGLENQGLNRWGMNFAAGKDYEGYVWVRAEKPATLYAAMESGDGKKAYAERELKIAGRGEGEKGRGTEKEQENAGDWRRIDFTLTPTASDTAGRFALKLKQPGDVTIGHVFLEPGEWGRFKGLPVRRDVAEGMINQGLTFVRYGGSMVNNSGYRWKNMIGPRDRRPPYIGLWYHYSTNGWGIPDFMAFCEAAGFEYAPAFNMGESPQDMADFIDYTKSPADSEWGSKRADDGHPAPYHIRYMELGNEERVDEKYAQKFEALAAAIWAKDPKMILVVGDYAYNQPIVDPFNFPGAASRITTLAGQQRILHFAKKHNGEVWFDVHISTDHPVAENGSLNGMFSFTSALDKLADGARHKVVVFEFNSGNHAQKRALANALAINAIERDGRTPIACCANGLQPDKQNDNGWDQGLLFLNPSQVWLQPPGYLTQILSKNYEPKLVQCDVTAPGAAPKLDANAHLSEDGKTLVLQVANPTDKAMTVEITLTGFTVTAPKAQVIELAGPAGAVNTADAPNTIVPRQTPWQYAPSNGKIAREFPPHSVTIIRFQ